MIANSIYGIISKTLLQWYSDNKRVLPWRDISDPYKIWISEVVLQQTRVNQGVDYYLRFVDRFPTIQILALATEDEVLKYWQGLGYYSRARNLHKAAQQIMNNFNGEFPIEHQHVLSLAGIGDYTAAAICSFAYNQPYPVVDGNVYRVISRVFGISTPIDSGAGKKEFAALAGHLQPVVCAGEHNQAIMEFGALQCVPMSPNCTACPLKSVCKAFELDLIGLLPVKSKKTKVSNRFFNYLFVQSAGATFFQKREEKDVWRNLYEFPLIEADALLPASELVLNQQFTQLFADSKEWEILKISNPVKHVLSHQVISAQFVFIRLRSNYILPNCVKVPLDKVDDYAVSRLMEQFLETI